MVVDIVGTCLALHSAKRRLTAVEEMVVSNGDIFRIALHVYRSVALGLIAVAAGFAVEEVEMVNPAVGIVRIERHGVVHAKHDAEVAQFNADSIAQQKSESPHGGILAYALYRYVHRDGVVPAFHLQAFGLAAELVHIGITDGSHEADGERTCLQTFLIGVDDGLQSGECLGLVVFSSHDIKGHGPGRSRRDIYNPCTGLKSTVVVVCTDAGIVEMCKTRTVVVPHCHARSHTGLAIVLDTVDYGHHLKRIAVGGSQPHHICTAVSTVAAHQLTVNPCIFGILSAFDIYIIRCSATIQIPYYICRLEPSARLGYLNATGGDLGSGGCLRRI